MGQCSSTPEAPVLTTESPLDVQRNIVERTPIFPALLTAAPLEYILPKVSGICIDRFLRWGERDADGEFLYDPDQHLTRKVDTVLEKSGLIPSIRYYDGETFQINARNILPGRNIADFPLSEFQKAVDFLKSHRAVFIGYMTIATFRGMPGGHAFLLKRITPESNNMDLIESNGQTLDQLINDPKTKMTPRSLNFFRNLVRQANINISRMPSCMFQTERGTCALWSSLAAIYSDRDSLAIKKMVDAAIKTIGLPPNASSYDMFIMELFYEFIQRPILASSVPADYKEGFGKKRTKKLKGKAMPEGLIPLQQMAKEAYNLVDPKKEINGWELKRWSPTLKFYVKGNEVIVAVRGTKANAPDGSLDVTADLTIPFNGIPGTIRYKRDKAMVENFQQEYPPSQYSYYGVGHSLGGAVIDSLIRDRLIREAVSYNPAIQFSDINRGLPNRRIYYGSDPLYRLMGWWDVKSEHREPENRTWADFLSGVSLPAAAMAALPAHNLSNFEGGRRVTFI